MSASERLQLRLTKHQHNRLKHRATLLGVTVSKLILVTTLGTPEEIEAMYERVENPRPVLSDEEFVAVLASLEI